MGKLFVVFALEGISIGFVASSMTILSTIWANEIEKDKNKLLIQFFATMAIAMTAHIMAEMLRHDRVLGMVDKVITIGKMRNMNLRKSFDMKMHHLMPQKY